MSGSTKSVGGPFDERTKAIARVANPLESEAKRLFEAKGYARALSKYQEAASVWESVGARGNHDEIVECLFRLGRYAEAVVEAKQNGIHNSQVALSVALSLVRLHRAGEARPFLNLDHMARYLPKEVFRYVPIPKDEATLEADLHLSRGMELFFTADYTEAHVELKQAYALDPKDLAISSLGLDTSLHLGKTDDALLFAAVASRLPGVHGDRARSYLTSARRSAESRASGAG